METNVPNVANHLKNRKLKGLVDESAALFTEEIASDTYDKLEEFLTELGLYVNGRIVEKAAWCFWGADEKGDCFSIQHWRRKPHPLM